MAALTYPELQDSHPELRDETLLDWVPIHKMFVAQYGRPLNQRKVNAMRRDFDPRALGTILLSFRANDSYAVLDGHHRKAAAEQEGYTHLAARIYIDLTYEQEAALYNRFATVNRQSALDRFRARLEAQEHDALMIRSILQARGMDIALNGSAIGRVSAVHELDTLYQAYGDAFLDQLVGVIYDGWGTSARAWITWSLHGMAHFWLRYREEVDRDHLIDVLTVTTPEALLSAARAFQGLRSQDSSILKAWGITMVDRYNHGLRKNKLGPWEDHIMSEEGRQAIAQGQAKGVQTRRAQREARQRAPEQAADPFNFG